MNSPNRPTPNPLPPSPRSGDASGGGEVQSPRSKVQSRDGVSGGGGTTVYLWVAVIVLSITVVILAGILLAIGVRSAPIPSVTTTPTTVTVATVSQSQPSASLPIEPVGSPYIVSAGRSPIPQPGEHFENPIPVPRGPHFESVGFGGSGGGSAGGSPATQTAAPQAPAVVSPITPQQADQHVGQTVTVEGLVVDTFLYTKDQLCFLNFRNGRQGFYVVIFKEALNSWPQAPHLYFRDKTIRVTGKVFQRGDRTQIRVNDASQIELVN